MRLADFFENFEVLAAAPGGVARLREAVLGLAVRGRLVAQDPADEPAAVLLERIAAERSRLVKEKKIKKSEPLPPVSLDEVPFDLPVGWEWVRLGDIIQISSGSALTSKKMEPGEIPVYGGNGITGFHNQYNVDKNTLIIGRVGFYCGSIHTTNSKSWVTDNAFITYFSKENIHLYFLYWLLKNTDLQVRNNATAQPVISGRKIYPIPVSLPPLAEQKRIVEAVDRLMEQLDRLEAQQTQQRDRLKILGTTATTQLTGAAETRDRVWPLVRDRFGTIYDTPENVEQLRQTILQLAVMGRLVPQDPNDEPASVLLERIRAEKARLIKEKKIKPSKPLPPISSDEMPFDLPKGWMWVKLGDFCQFDNGHAFKSRDYVSKSKNKLIRLGNVKNNQLLLNHNSVYLSDLMANQRKECLLKKDDLLVTMTGTKGKKDFGFTALVQSFHLIGIDLYLNQRVGRIRKISMTSMSLVSLFMGSSSLQDLLLRDSTGTANQANISASSIRNLLFPLPPLAEQKRIVATVDRLMTHCDQLQTQLQTRSDRAHTLLHSAIHQLSQTP